MTTPTFNTLKKAFLDSGYEIRFFPARRLERMALDSPGEVKRHRHSNIMGLIMPDENVIGIASELSLDEKVMTLVHELIHLYDDNLEEDRVEQLTEEMENNLTPNEYGFFQFLVA